MNVNAILLKPLDGYAPGSPRLFDKADFDRLRGMGAVREAGVDDDVEEVRQDDVHLLEQFRDPINGPTLLADMKKSFEALGTANALLQTDLLAARKLGDEAVIARDQAVVERDAAIVDRDAAMVERDTARDALKAAEADRDSLKTELDSLRAAHSKSSVTPKPKTGA